MQQLNIGCDFHNEIAIGTDIETTFNGVSLILKDVYLYHGPVTLELKKKPTPQDDSE